MHREPLITRRAVGFGLAGTFLAVSTASARQGVSPFGEATPVATAASTDATQGWKVAEAVALDLDGRVAALSPDGKWLAGIGPDRELAIWSVPGFEQTLVPFHEPIDIDSIAWSPDSTAIAFSLEAFLQGIDGDIFVYELADETIHNLTDDGYEGGYFTTDGTESFPIDVMPAWTPDSQAIVFARSVWEKGADSIPTEIARISRAGGDVEILLTIEARPFSIFTPMRVLTDGSIVYTFAFSDMDDAMNGIWKLDPDGNTSQLLSGTGADAFPISVLLDVSAGESELQISGISAALSGANDVTRPWLFSWSSDVGEPVPVADVDFTDPVRPFTAFWSPDGGTMLVIGRMLEGEGEITVETIGPASELTLLPISSGATSRGPRWIRPTWSIENTVLIPSVAGTPYLLTMEPVDSVA